MAEGVSASSLQAAFIELASIVRALHGDWSAPADGYEGWSCHDLLAHLSSSEAALPAVGGSSTQPPRPGAGPFGADRWNRSPGGQRGRKESQELVEEVDMGATQAGRGVTDTDLRK